MRKLRTRSDFYQTAFCMLNIKVGGRWLTEVSQCGAAILDGT